MYSKFMDVVLEIANTHNVEIDVAENLILALNLNSLEELDARHIGHYSVYNSIDELEHDIYEVHGKNIPYKIVHSFIVADEPLD